MGILTSDDGLVDAALSEMLSLPLDQRVAMDPHHDVNGLLVKHRLGQVSDVHLDFPLGSIANLLSVVGRHSRGTLGGPKGDLRSAHIEGTENPSRNFGLTRRSRRPGSCISDLRRREFGRNASGICQTAHPAWGRRSYEPERGQRTAQASAGGCAARSNKF